MSVVAEIVAIAAGVLVVWLTLLSAIRTVVMPHGRTSSLTRTLFLVIRRVLLVHRRLPRLSSRRHLVMSLYAPLSLVCLPLVWLTGALVGFTAIFWGLGTHPWRDALKLSGSSMLTLGWTDADDLPRMLVSFFAAALAISVLALLLVTYLPSMYQAFSSREKVLTGLETFAGEPADPVELLVRHQRIGATDRLSDIWSTWRDWFFEARDTHTALPAVVLFRSTSPDREWVPAVGALLDAAALWNSVCIETEDPDASLCIRSGSIALNDIAETFRLDFVTDPHPDDPISIDRADFDAMYDRLAAEHMTTVDRTRAWTDWSGWRVNYDTALEQLTALTTLDD